MDRLPYIYKLTFKPQSLVYVGSSTRKGCHPNDFWSKYYTSSKVVKELLQLFGDSLEIWSFDIVEIFHSYEDIKDVIRKENSIIHTFMKDSNTKCINSMCHLTDGAFTVAGYTRSEEFKDNLRKAKTGVKRTNFNTFEKTIYTFKHMDTGQEVKSTRRSFSLDYGLSSQEVYNIVSGRIRHSKRWGVLNTSTGKFSFETPSNAKPPTNTKTCEYCKKVVSTGNYSRWHGDKCKLVDATGHIERSRQIASINSCS